jgi:hypothetical protein
MSAMPTLAQITEVAEIVAGTMLGDTAEINAYLKAGWILLATRTAGDARGGQQLLYAVGWSRELGEPQHPTVPDGGWDTAAFTDWSRRTQGSS